MPSHHPQRKMALWWTSSTYDQIHTGVIGRCLHVHLTHQISGVVWHFFPLPKDNQFLSGWDGGAFFSTFANVLLPLLFEKLTVFEGDMLTRIVLSRVDLYFSGPRIVQRIKPYFELSLFSDCSLLAVLFLLYFWQRQHQQNHQIVVSET